MRCSNRGGSRYIILEPRKDVWAVGIHFRGIMVFEIIVLDKRWPRK